jgi:hypothetical protein
VTIGDYVNFRPACERPICRAARDLRAMPPDARGIRAGIADAQGEGMGGFITERNFDEAEAAFPGIVAFYRALGRKPRTFLELVQLFLERGGAGLKRSASEARA